VQRLPACEQRHPAADVDERVAGLGSGRASDARFDLVQSGVHLRRTDKGEKDEAAQRRPGRGVGRAGEPLARDLFGGLDLPGDGQGTGAFDGDAVGVDRVLADPRGGDREQFGRLQRRVLEVGRRSTQGRHRFGALGGRGVPGDQRRACSPLTQARGTRHVERPTNRWLESPSSTSRYRSCVKANSCAPVHQPPTWPPIWGAEAPNSDQARSR
jgi:hypothetical protein